MNNIKTLTAAPSGTLFVNGRATWHAIDATTQGQVSDILRAVWAYDDLAQACKLHEAKDEHLLSCDICRPDNPCDMWRRLYDMALKAQYKGLATVRADIRLTKWAGLAQEEADR